MKDSIIQATTSQRRNRTFCENRQHKLYYHKLGTSQTTDQLIFGGDKNTRRSLCERIRYQDQKYLVVTAANATSGNELYIKDLKKSKQPDFKPIDKGFDND